VTDYLLDTVVVSELAKPQPNRNVIRFIEGRSLDSLFISEIAFAEIRFGIEKQSDPARRSEIVAWLTNELRPMFAQRTLPVSEDIVFRWRLLVAEGRKIRHTFTQPDLFLAATALVHGLTLATRNVKDFEHTKARLLNPWERGD
jgi:hypothetical protein